MVRIIVASTPVHGHVSPLLSVASHLVRRCHEVTVLTGSRFEARARAAGADFAALPEGADWDERNLGQAFPERGRLRPGPEQLGFDLKHIFGDPVPAQYAALRSLLTRFPATAVISDNLFLGALPLALGQIPGNRPATIALGIAPPTVPGDFNPEDFHGAQQYIERVFDSVDAPLPGFVLDSLLRVPDHFLQLTVPGFEYPRDDAPASFAFIGPLPPEPSTPRLLPDWWDELPAERPVVVVTQGTFANTDLADLVVPTLRALAGEDALVIAATGRKDGPAAVRALMHEGVPGNVRLADYVPFELLLPATDVLVTNGGYGGVHTALRHGVPQGVAGATEDKPKVAARVAWSGAGIDLRTGRPSETALRTAVTDVLGVPDYRTRARELCAEMNRFDALGHIALLVEKHAAERG
ncbi:glycosyltransferase [Streptomyces sp. NPDC056672]|uniref:glycosyltransferase n=1 Tax=Streptomyces sp. NPDC056672 TaxID=3345906 RepID=UPI00369DF00E